ncbi:hypothetical protein Zmor_014014 [Zophobas morio]|uniref:Serpin domain-containing protein n=1 Tax=Zophobas morio TaxID=2755281 RepID=A0AA38IG95_9CUCU|nr:hypothetical protein Zmor_014014 [Zophobas morio]
MLRETTRRIVTPFLNQLDDDENGIAELEKNLANLNLAEITEDMWPRPVIVALPKFTAEQTIDLKSPLTKLVFGEIFDKSVANFSGMTTGNEQVLFVSEFIQKVYIEVSEQAAEATGTVDMFCRMPDEFIADHPFLYFLCDKKSSCCIFAGRLFNPNTTS